MLTPEDFRRQLDEALVAKQKADQAAQEETDANRLQGQAKQQEMVAQGAIKVAKEADEERQRNQTVLELDSQLPIRQYLEILRDKIAPGQNVERWGPEHGEIAYSLICDQWEAKVIEEAEEGKEGEEKNIIVKDVLGFKINNEGFFGLFEHQCTDDGFDNYYKNIHYEKGTNPFLWKKWRTKYASTWDYVEEQEKNFQKFLLDPTKPLEFPKISWGEDEKFLVKPSLTSPEGTQLFTQLLTNFCVNFKSRQGK